MEDQSSSRPVSASSSSPVHSCTASTSPPPPPPPPPASSSSSSSPSSPLSHCVNGSLDPLAAAVKVSCGSLAITSSSGVITPPVFASTSSSPASSSSSSSSSSPSSPRKSPHRATCLLTSNSHIEPHTQVTHITEATDPLNASHLIMPSFSTTSPPSIMATSSPASPPPTPIIKTPYSATSVTSFTSQVMSSLTPSSINSNSSCIPGATIHQQQTHPQQQQPQHHHQQQQQQHQHQHQQQQQQWYSRPPVHLFHSASGAPVGPPSPPSSTIGLMSSSGVDHHQWGALTAAVVAGSSYVPSPHSSPTLYSHATHANMVHHASAAAAAPNAGVQQYTDAYYNPYYGSGENFAAVAEMMSSSPQSNESMSHAFNTTAGTINSSLAHSATHHSTHSHHHNLAGFSPRSSSSILMSSSASPIVDPLSPASEVSPASSTGTTSSVCQSDQLDMKPTSMALLSDHTVGGNNLHGHDENLSSHLNTHPAAPHRHHYHHHHHHHHPHHLHFRSLQGDNCDLSSLDTCGVIPKVEADATSPSLVSSTSSMVGSFISSNGGTIHSNNLHLLNTPSDMSSSNSQSSRPQPVRSPYEWISSSKKCSSNNHSNNNNSQGSGNNNSSNNNNNNNNNNNTNNTNSNSGTNSSNSSNSNSNSTYPPSQAPPGKTRTRDKYRVVYSDHQRQELEKEFTTSKYITIRRKSDLASMLALSERQVKIWFQNRRAKDRKQTKKREEGKSKDNSISHHHHLTNGQGGGGGGGSSVGSGGQMSSVGQTSHHMLSKDGLMINGTMASTNMQTAVVYTNNVGCSNFHPLYSPLSF